MVKIAEARRPILVLLENVPGFFALSKPWCQNLTAGFKVSGYRCSFDLTASAFDLPQARKRGFIVAVREDIHPVPFTFPPAPEGKEVTLRDCLLPAGSADLQKVLGVKARDFPMAWGNKWLSEPALRDVVDMVRADQRTNRNRGLILLEWRAGKKRRWPSRVYHDLGHIPTVMTGMNDNGWTLTRGAEGEDPVVRRLHVKELRKVQGFPDSFILADNITPTCKHLGHAVLPAMIRWMGLLLMEKFGHAFLDDAEATSKASDSGSSSRKRGRSSSRKRKRSSSQAKARSSKSRHRRQARNPDS